MVKFDLHLHSDNSDGSAAVKELVSKVEQAGIRIFALTDHDTIAGVNEAAKYVSNNMKFIKGVELTCIADGIKCHILGYNINPDNNELEKLIEHGKILRKQKLETRIKYLKDVWNIELTKEELQWLYSRKSVVKTHLANILVSRGLANDNVSAMKKYLDACKTGNTKFEARTAIKTIIHAGGIPIWAHPLGGEGEKHLTKAEFLPKLKTMIEFGIQGLECYYSRYSTKEAEFLAECARKNHLLISGGSDWHGTNKTVILGRLNTDDIEIDSQKISVLNAI